MDVIDEDWEEWDSSKGKFWHHMLAGSCAGVMEHTAMFPIDTYKVRLRAAVGGCAIAGFAVAAAVLNWRCSSCVLRVRRASLWR